MPIEIQRFLKEMSTINTSKSSSSSREEWTLEVLPRHVLVHSILLTHCTGADVRALASASKGWWKGLEYEDDLWRSLYENRGVRFPRCPPRFPTCGTWRDVYLRSIRFQSLVIVRTLTRPKEDLRLVLSRTTPLYGLKREIRERQRVLDGVALEDFELRDYYSKMRLGIAGNDSLPPADLRRLFWMDLNGNHHQNQLNANMARFGGPPGGGGGGVVGAPHPNHEGPQNVINRASSFIGVDGWRVNLTSISDGAVFEQIFVSTQAGSEPNRQIAEFEGELQKSMPNVQSVNLLLEKSNRELAGVGPTAFKTFWRQSSVHPLLKLAMDSRLEWRQRLVSLMLFARQVMKTIVRIRFMSDVLVRAILTSGFPLSFARLSMEIFPMVWKTQIKQMLEADFDFGFALRLVRDVLRATNKAFSPVIWCAFKIELGRVLLRQVLTWESSHEDFILNGLTLAKDFFLHRHSFMKILDPILFWDTMIEYIMNSHTVDYAISSLLWGMFESRSESALSVTLPLYFYALPVIACAVVLRARVFLAQSYVSLLFA